MASEHIDRGTSTTELEPSEADSSVRGNDRVPDNDHVPGNNHVPASWFVTEGETAKYDLLHL
jgi:hypothetical protein